MTSEIPTKTAVDTSDKGNETDPAGNDPTAADAAQADAAEGNAADPDTAKAGEGKRPVGAGYLTRLSVVGRSRQLYERLGYVVALLPVLYIVRQVNNSPQLPFQDYWAVLARVTNLDGSIHLRGFFTYVNEHPFVVPSTLYYLDAKFLDGTNHALGYYTVIVALLAVVMLRSILPPTWDGLARAWMTAAMSVIVFTPAGLWNFVRGMSGAAWYTANLFALIAILLAFRGRTVLAVIAAGLSILSYSTGFGAPVAIVVVALLARQRPWRWELPAAFLVAALLGYEATSKGGTSGGGITHDPVLLSSTFFTNLGLLWDSSAGALAVFAGASGLAILVFGFWSARAREDFADLVPWWGVATYAVCASGLISIGRSETFAGNGAQGRYASLSALFWLSVLVVTVRLVLANWAAVTRIAAITVTATCFVAGSTTLSTAAVSENDGQRLEAAAIRIGLPAAFEGRIYQPNEQVTRLKALGDYPFVPGYQLGCGRRLGDVIDVTKIRDLPVPQGGNYGALDTDALTVDARQFTGWVKRGVTPTRCVLVIDAVGKVIGGGVIHTSRPDAANQLVGIPATVGFLAISPGGIEGTQLVVGFDDGFFRLTKA